jgi:phosphatidylglycerophosphate synthase
MSSSSNSKSVANAREPVLWVPAAPDGLSPATMLLGLPIARRIALAAQRAGFRRVLFEEPAEAGPVRQALAKTDAELVPPTTPAPAGAVTLPAGTLPAVWWLEARIASPRTQAQAQTQTEAKSEAGLISIRSAGDLPDAERWLLRGLVKDTEGFMSRHLERRISLAISRRLASTPVTPNAMTLFSVGVGLGGAALFLSSRVAVQFTGALLFLFHSILDGCDGELARLKFLESRRGGVLDFWGDNVVHSAVFGALALEWNRTTGDPWTLVAGFAAIAGTLLSATFVFRQMMWEPRAEAGEGPLFTSVTARPATRVSRLADALARRDFIYLIVILAAFGKAHWFLVLAAFGSPLFFLALVAMEISGRRLGRSYS